MCLNHQLAKVKSLPGLTDNVERANPAYAADLYLKMENAVDSVLRMGSRNQSLEYVAFNDNTIYNITSKLPWKLESQTYEFSSDKFNYGKDKLTRVLTLIRKARHVAHSRATDQSNMEPLAPRTGHAITKETSQITLTNQQQAQSKPLALTQATGTNKPARFISWRELC